MSTTDRIRLLETFIRIVERGSISAAARDLNLSQASASRQLAQLEAQLNSALIARSTHSLSLTEAGEQLLPRARDLIARWSALDDLADTDGPLTGSIRVVAPVALGQTILLPALTDFQKDHPHLRVTWRLEDQTIRFAEEGCDVWINIGHPPDENLISREVTQVRRVVVAAPSVKSVTSPQQLIDRPCVSLGPFEGTQLPLTGPSGRTVRLSLTARLATNSIMVSHAAAKAGLGFAVLPEWLIQEDLKTGTLVNLLPEWIAPSLPITINYAPASRQLRRLIAFRAAMEDAIQNAIGADDPES
ncbi:MAG: LysR family transcriptional regulator [Pseudomonadota bacterium]